MRGTFRSWFCLFLFLIHVTALADGMNSGWTFTLACPTWDQVGDSGTITANNSSGFSCSGGSCGSCSMLPGSRFQAISISGETLPSGATLNSSTFYSLNIGKFLFVPPVLSTDLNPIFAVASQCNNYTTDVSYLFIQIDPASFSSIKSSYFWGKSTLSPVSTTLTSNYDISGTQTWSGSDSLPIGSCSGGTWTVSGTADFNAKMYTGNDWSGLYKTGPGRATLFLTEAPITQSYLGSTTYSGLYFSSGTPGSVENVQVTSNAAGSVFTITPYTNVSTSSLSGSTFDTITITAINTPFSGAMKGTVSRNGAGSGRVACLANLGGGLDGQLVACSGEDPNDNSTPYAVVFDHKLPSGSLDSLFNGTGLSVNQVSAYTYPDSEGHSLAIDNAGRIVVAGTAADTNGYNNFAVVRFTSTGVLDSTFNGNGIAFAQPSTNSNPDSSAFSLAIDNAGRIVVAGGAADTNNYNNFTVVRFTSAGVLDTTFNGNGVVMAQPSTYVSGFDSRVYSLAIDSVGRIVAAGYAADLNGNDSFAAARFTSEGALDTTFNGNGIAVAQPSPYSSTPFSQVHSLAIDSAGRIVVAGTAADSNGNNSFALARFTAAGALDTTFNGSGMALRQLPTGATVIDSEANALAIDSSGRLVVAGTATDSTGNENFAVARFTSAGALDTSFNGNGVVLVQPPTGSSNPDSVALSLAIDSLGRIVVAGAGNATVYSGPEILALARFDSTGALDTAFNGTGTVLTQVSPAAAPFSRAYSVVIDAIGRIVVAGYAADSQGNYSFAAARYVP